MPGHNMPNGNCNYNGSNNNPDILPRPAPQPPRISENGPQINRRPQNNRYPHPLNNRQPGNNIHPQNNPQAHNPLGHNNAQGHYNVQPHNNAQPHNARNQYNAQSQNNAQYSNNQQYLYNRPHPQYGVPFHTPNGARLYAAQQLAPRFPSRMIFMMGLPEPIPSYNLYSRPLSPPPAFVPPCPNNSRHENDYDIMETNYEEDAEQGPAGIPVNFALCESLFSGLGDVRTFINAVLDFKNRSEMQDDSAFRSFPLLLTDHAATWWDDNKIHMTDFNCAIRMLRDNYRARTQQHRIYRRFFTTPQDKEPTAEFVQRARGLFSKLPFNTLTAETQLDLIFSTLHRRIKDMVNREDCHNFMDLLDRARQVEEMIAARGTAPPQSTPAEENEVTVEEPAQLELSTKPEPSELDQEAAAVEVSASLQLPASPQDAVPKEESTDAPMERSASIETGAPVEAIVSTDAVVPMEASLPKSKMGESCESPCEHCRVYGQLLERTCRKLHKGERSPPNVSLVKNAAKPCKIVCFRCRSEDIVDLKCKKCSNEISQGCPQISVTIYDMDFKFIVDTGSSHSVISPELLAHLNACGQEFTSHPMIRPVAGEEPVHEMYSMAAVEVIAAGVRIETQLIYCPNSSKSIFGMDFIKQAGLLLDFRGEGTWTVRGGQGEHPVIFKTFY